MPARLQIASGDAQSGPGGGALPEPLVVRVTDNRGEPVAGFPVRFVPEAGEATPGEVPTDGAGRASTRLTLPLRAGTVRVRGEGSGVGAVLFRVEAEPRLALVDETLPPARLPFPHLDTLALQTAGGGDVRVTLAAGSLPPGLTLDGEAAVLAGTPTASGAWTFRLRATDAAGGVFERDFVQRVCPPAGAPALGRAEVVAPAAPGGCGVFLPAGPEGARYRIALVGPPATPDTAPVARATLRVDRRAASGAFVPPGGEPARSGPGEPTRPGAVGARPAIPRLSSPGDGASHLARAADHETRRRHVELREEERRLVRRLGAAHVLDDRVPLRRHAASRPVGASPPPLPQVLRYDPGTPTSCEAGVERSAVKLVEDARLALYQDSAQHARAGTRVSADQGRRLLDFHRDHGRAVVDGYFGGVSDIDGNGRVVLVVTPAASGGLGAFVWSGDFFPKSVCPASNEGEFVYLNHLLLQDLTAPAAAKRYYGAYGLLVHELKHVASLYRRVLRLREHDDDYQPAWVEEGTAEIAAETAARRAWALRGGPAEGAVLDAEDWRASGLDDVNATVRRALERAQGYLASQPNASTSTPEGAARDHTPYGAGWLFHRWLADAYGGAETGAFGDAAFFRLLVASQTPSGIAGIERVTGRPWARLMEEFAAAAMANGQPGPPLPRPFRRYDFVSAIDGAWCFAVDPIDLDASGCRGAPGTPGPPGAFPWPVTTEADGVRESRPFESAVYAGPLAPDGLRVHELVSDGTGLGVELSAEVADGARLVVLRLR